MLRSNAVVTAGCPATIPANRLDQVGTLPSLRYRNSPVKIPFPPLMTAFSYLSAAPRPTRVQLRPQRLTVIHAYLATNPLAITRPILIALLGHERLPH